MDPMLTSKSLASLPHWNGGENHLLISFVTGNSDSLRSNHGSAMVAAAGYSTFSYRNQFDIALPSYTTLQEKSVPVVPLTSHDDHPDLVVIQGDDLDPKLLSRVRNLKDVGIFYPSKSNPSNYEMREDIHGRRVDTLAILSKSKFCFIGKEKHGRLTTPMLMTAMHAGCVPIVAIDSLVLPFSEVVDWKRFSIRFYEHDVHLISDILANISDDRYRQMKSQLTFVYEKYFKDLPTITHTILAILNERIFPQKETEDNKSSCRCFSFSFNHYRFCLITFLKVNEYGDNEANTLKSSVIATKLHKCLSNVSSRDFCNIFSCQRLSIGPLEAKLGRLTASMQEYKLSIELRPFFNL